MSVEVASDLRALGPARPSLRLVSTKAARATETTASKLMADRKITTFAAPNVADMTGMVGSFAPGGQLPKQYLSPLSSVARARPRKAGGSPRAALLAHGTPDRPAGGLGGRFVWPQAHNRVSSF